VAISQTQRDRHWSNSRGVRVAAHHSKHVTAWPGAASHLSAYGSAQHLNNIWQLQQHCLLTCYVLPSAHNTLQHHTWQLPWVAVCMAQMLSERHQHLQARTYKASTRSKAHASSSPFRPLRQAHVVKLGKPLTKVGQSWSNLVGQPWSTRVSSHRHTTNTLTKHTHEEKLSAQNTRLHTPQHKHIHLVACSSRVPLKFFKRCPAAAPRRWRCISRQPFTPHQQLVQLPAFFNFSSKAISKQHPTGASAPPPTSHAGKSPAS
jgi:hypothetical protein